MRRREVNMLSGSIVKGILALSLPLMIMNVVQALFNAVDMTILKQYDMGGGIAVGAVGVCSTLITLISGLVSGVSTGANVVVAKNIGRRDQAAVDRAICSAIAFALTGGLVLAVVGVLGGEFFLKLVNCPDRLIAEATLYFQLYFAGVPLLMVYNFCAAILRASGDSQRPMIFLTIGGVMKVILTYVCIAFFQLGVKGVAIATIVSWGTSVTLALITLIRGTGTVRLYVKRIGFYKRETLDMLRIGVPAGVQQALYSIANVSITATVNTFGAEATTGVSIANIYDGVMYQISYAVSLGVLPYVSQNIGAGNKKRAMQSVWRGVGLTICLGGFFGGLSAIFSGPLASIMSSDPLVIDFARQKMVLISATYFLCGISDTIAAALRGMGRPMPPAITTMLYMCGLRLVWVYFVFPLNPVNLTFLYLVWPISWICCIVTLLSVYLPASKKLLAEHKQENPAG